MDVSAKANAALLADIEKASARVSVRTTEHAGRGLFAAKSLKKGMTDCEAARSG